jgi:hypothetical protein
MNEDELRALVRQAVEKHLGGEVIGGPQNAATPALSISFGQYPLERAPGDTSCLIEPAVRCNHCGFCKCHGH